MAIRIPENIMNRPLLPGSEGGGPDPTRQFGNRQEQFANQPGVPQGLFGVPTPHAGAVGEATARAAEQITKATTNLIGYAQDLTAADEDSRQQAMRLEMRRHIADKDVERANDPEFQRLTPDQQREARAQYNRNYADTKIQEGAFTNKKIIKHVNDAVNNDLANDDATYYTKTIVPNMINGQKKAIADQVGSLIGTALTTGDPTDAFAARNQIEIIRNDPKNIALLGGVQAANEAAEEQKKQLYAGIVTGAHSRGDDTAGAGLQRAIAADPTLAGKITKDQLAPLTEGATPNAVQVQMLDDQGRVLAALKAAGADDLTISIEMEKYKTAQQRQYGAAAAAHNDAYALGVKQRDEAATGAITQGGDNLFLLGGRGEADPATVNKWMDSTLRQLGIDPEDARADKLTDPVQQKRYHQVLLQANRATTEQRRYRNEQERELKDANTNRLMQELLSRQGGSMGQSFTDKKYKELVIKEGGATFSRETVDFIKINNAVPTQLMQVLAGDLQSGDDARAANASKVILAIDSMGPKIQGAMYKLLPPELDGVLPLLRAGKSYKGALEELNRRKVSPEAEKALDRDWGSNSEAGKASKTYVEKAAKAAGYDLSNMSPQARDIFERDAKDSYIQFGGNSELAISGVVRKAAQNSRVRPNPMAGGRLEVNPITYDPDTKQDVPVDGINAVADKLFPATKDNKTRTFMPNGPTLTPNGLVNTYTVITIDEKTNMVVTHDTAFHVTPALIEEAISEKETAERAAFRASPGGRRMGPTPITRAEKAAEKIKVQAAKRQAVLDERPVTRFKAGGFKGTE